MEKTALKLPSKCLCYEGVVPENLTIRTLKGRDEKLIAEISKDNYEKKFNQLLSGCIEGIDTGKLTLGDRKYVMLWLAINSYGSIHPIEFVCENCLNKLKLDVDLKSLTVTELPDDFKTPYSITLLDGSLLNLRLLTINDEIKLAEFEKNGQNTWGYRWALSIVNDMTFMDKVNLVDNMEAKDIAKIRAFHEQFAHGPILETKYECEKCGGDGITPIPFRFELFFPYGEKLTRFFGTTS